MFTTDKIPAFLQAVKFAGDSTKKLLEMTFFLTPASYDLVSEVAPWMAEAMFREDQDGAWQPATGMPSARFDDPKIPLQTMSLHPLPDAEFDNLGAMLQNVGAHSFCSMKLFADKPDLTLSFKVSVERSQLAMELADRYHRKKEKVFLSFGAMQGELPLEKENTFNGEALCEECDLVAAVIDSEGQTFCRTHLRLGVGEVRELHPERRETPKQAEQRVLREALAGNSPVGAVYDHPSPASDDPGGKIGEPGGPPAVEEVDLSADASFINQRNRGRKKKPAERVN